MDAPEQLDDDVLEEYMALCAEVILSAFDDVDATVTRHFTDDQTSNSPVSSSHNLATVSASVSDEDSFFVEEVFAEWSKLVNDTTINGDVSQDMICDEKSTTDEAMLDNLEEEDLAEWSKLVNDTTINGDVSR